MTRMPALHAGPAGVFIPPGIRRHHCEGQGRRRFRPGSRPSTKGSGMNAMVLPDVLHAGGRKDDVATASGDGEYRQQEKGAGSEGAGHWFPHGQQRPGHAGVIDAWPQIDVTSVPSLCRPWRASRVAGASLPRAMLQNARRASHERAPRWTAIDGWRGPWQKPGPGFRYPCTSPFPNSPPRSRRQARRQPESKTSETTHKQSKSKRYRADSSVGRAADF